MGEHNDTPRSLGYTPEEQDLMDQLDALGREERSIPDPGFESRLLGRVGSAIAPDPVPIVAPRRGVPVLRYAAAAAVLLGVGSIALLQSGVLHSSTPGETPYGTTLASAIESLEDDLEALDTLGSFSESLETRIAEVGLMTQQVDTELLMPSVFVEFGSNEQDKDGAL